MCGRFNLRLSPAELRVFFDLFRVPEFEPRFNIAPLQTVLAIRLDEAGRRVADPLQWGLVPHWAREATIASQMINAKSESADEQTAFRDSLRLRRCLIPASGFYEWEHLHRRVKQPWQITLRSGQPLALAGLWDRWQPPEGPALESCTILTTAANNFLSALHDRMPVIVPRAVWSAWLDPALTKPQQLAPYLLPCPDEWLQRTPANPRLNNVRHEGPECLAPTLVQGSLF